MEQHLGCGSSRLYRDSVFRRSVLTYDAEVASEQSSDQTSIGLAGSGLILAIVYA